MTRHRETRNLTGAEALLNAARDRGVSVCFANPGTTEMPIVAALDRTAGMRAVLGLHEGVCTGAADGYARVSDTAAMTLLHLGPGLANGLSNLHNARRAGSPIVNVVGDHASWHLPFDAPLTSDIAALARTVGALHQVRDRATIAATTRHAVDDAHDGGVSTLVVPADVQQHVREEPPTVGPPPALRRPAVGMATIEEVGRGLLAGGSGAVLLLGGDALSRSGQLAAGRIAATTGATVYSETFPPRAERGGGLPAIDRLPYFPETAAAALRDAGVVVLAGARAPVAYFGYEGIPSALAPEGRVLALAGAHNAERALIELADQVGASGQLPAAPPVAEPPGNAALTGAAVGAALAHWLPADAIVSVEGGTCGYPFWTASAAAAPHTALTNTGGAIGQGLPAALGAAIAAPDRPVIALQSDGSALYTAQALWTMAREQTGVVVLIAANHTYNILRTELRRHASTEPGPQADQLTSLGDPRIDWTSLAAGYGIPAATAGTVGELHSAFASALQAGGPQLIQMAM